MLFVVDVVCFRCVIVCTCPTSHVPGKEETLTHGDASPEQLARAYVSPQFCYAHHLPEGLRFHKKDFLSSKSDI